MEMLDNLPPAIGLVLALLLVVWLVLALLVPFMIESSTYAISSLVVLLAAAVSALVVRRRIDGFDLVAVLKTRD